LVVTARLDTPFPPSHFGSAKFHAEDVWVFLRTDLSNGTVRVEVFADHDKALRRSHRFNAEDFFIAVFREKVRP
jgi:hypothetical protein